MEPFNLNSDRQYGHFDENMNFIFKKEQQEVDNWLSGMTEEQMERAIGEAAQAAKVSAMYITHILIGVLSSS